MKNPPFKPKPKDANEDMAELFKALGHPDRVRLVAELSDTEKDVNTLCESLGVRQARISQHLAVLRANHVVEDRKEGRHVLYRLARPALAAWLIVGGMALGEGAPAAEESLIAETRIVETESEEKHKKRSKA